MTPLIVYIHKQKKNSLQDHKTLEVGEEKKYEEIKLLYGTV